MSKMMNMVRIIVIKLMLIIVGINKKIFVREKIR